MEKPTTTVDVLSDVLDGLRPVCVTTSRCEMRGEWSVSYEAVDAARFVVVARGSAWFRTQASGWQHVQAGEAVLLPRGVAYDLASQPSAFTAGLHDVHVSDWACRVRRIDVGSGSCSALLFGGTVRLESQERHPWLGLLPDYLHTRQTDCEASTLMHLLDFMAEELATQRPGAPAVLSRLADVVVVSLIRSWILQHDATHQGIVGAMRDRRIGQALAAVHRSPGERWSVDNLAKLANLSRSAFAQRFTAAMGMPVAAYVSQVRMQLAGRWLRQQDITVSQVAQRLGYESEASFSRAFKKTQGMPPSEVRHAAARGA
jgi:AraC-like DNA-binding protein